MLSNSGLGSAVQTIKALITGKSSRKPSITVHVVGLSLPDDLLAPIPGTNGLGVRLNFRVHEEINEALREDDPYPKGDWNPKLPKKADHRQVVELACKALTTQIKDLKLAVRLVHALWPLEKVRGLTEGLDVTAGLLDGFWDTIHPEMVDGDEGRRAGLLRALAAPFATFARTMCLTENGLDWSQYLQSREVGYEKDADTPARKKQWTQAITEKQLTAEAFDRAWKDSSAAWKETVVEELSGLTDSLQRLQAVCLERFHTERLDFGEAQKAWTDIQDALDHLPNSKKSAGPDKTAQSEISSPPQTVAQPKPLPPDAQEPLSLEIAKQDVQPISSDDAVRRIQSIAQYLRKQEPSNPVPYLLLRGLHWGELRAKGPLLDAARLSPPSSEIRLLLRQKYAAAKWHELLDSAEETMTLPCGRAWLDLQRYVVEASEALGGKYLSIARAVLLGFKGLLLDFPEFPRLQLADGTPAADDETRLWIIRDVIGLPDEHSLGPLRPVDSDLKPHNGEAEVIDAHEMAIREVRGGRPREAIAILRDQIAQERSGRSRFQRKTQLASVCVDTGHDAIARSILEELAEEIDFYKLDKWEGPSFLVHPLSMLYRCLTRVGADDGIRQSLYRRICRIDPILALDCDK